MTEQEKIREPEIWKEVPGYEHYQISNFGRVRKISYLSNWHSENIGYPQVQLFKGEGHGKRGKKRTKSVKFFIHRLIAEAFIPNPNGLPIINHKDGNKTNYAIDNLEWCDYSHNSAHAYKLGLNKGGKSQQNRVVVQIAVSGEIVKVWNGVRDITANGHTWNKVYDSIRRNTKYKGYKWHYVDFNYDYRRSEYFSREDGKKTVWPISVVISAIFSQFMRPESEYLQYHAQKSKD